VLRIIKATLTQGSSQRCTDARFRHSLLASHPSSAMEIVEEPVLNRIVV
jgi:hypothetical protein